MATKKFKVGDKYFAVRKGGFSEHYTVEVREVKSVTETDTGYTYNDRERDFYMYTDFEKAKEVAKSKAKEVYDNNIKALDEMRTLTLEGR